MKSIIKITFEYFGLFISFFRNEYLIEMWHAACSHLYTGMIKGKFKAFGNGSIIERKALNLKGLSNVTVGDNTQIESMAQITAWNGYEGTVYNPQINIGDNCKFRNGIHISAIGNIIIGNGVLTGTNVLISDNSHGILDNEMLSVLPYKRQLYTKGGITIGDNVWLGNNVCVVSGVTIGEGSIIGANSVVTNNIPPKCMAAGIPAKVIKSLI